jgi:DNA-binding transcriptional LysR family regulator
VSQPAISKQISALEKELGAKLFVRNNQKTELTEVGRLYFDFFSRYKAELLNTKYEAEQLMGKSKGVVRVGFLEGWDLFDIIPPMMERFKAEYPKSDVIINCCGIKELTSSLFTDSMDLVVTMKNSVSRFMEFSIRDVAEVCKILMFSGRHSLAGKDGITLKDFSRDKFLAPWEIEEKLIIEAIASYTRPYGFVPKLSFVKNHESLVTCVRNNMGVAIVDEWVWAKGAADLCWIPFNAKDTISIARMRTKRSEQVIALESIIAGIIDEQKKQSNT